MFYSAAGWIPSPRSTMPCYVGGEVHCGECGTCVERREAFIDTGIPDPTSYLNTTPLPLKPSTVA